MKPCTPQKAIAHLPILARTHKTAFILGAATLTTLVTAPVAVADENGRSFWVPGLFGSLAATPQQPGWSFASIYYHTSVSLTVPGNVNARLNADADLGLAITSYAFASPVLGGQAAVSLLVPFGRNRVSVDATGFTDSVIGFGDLGPQASLRWNFGVHNWMTYITGDIPIGKYGSSRPANLGIGHGAVDAGGGYSYFNPQTGHEFSAVLGFTYNFNNTDTQYQNGVDMHIDWGVSQFVTQQWQVGLVGYFYQQLSCDSGSGNRAGCFQSRVNGIGPQIGHIFQIGEHHQGYLNLRGYKEFGAEHRPEGWNVWLTFAITPATAPRPTPSNPMIVK